MTLFRRITYLLIIYFCLIGSLTFAQEDSPAVGVLLTSDAVTEGYVLFSPIRSPYAYLINNAGELVHQWESEFPILSAYLLENGDLLAAVTKPDSNFPIGGTGRVERYDWDNNLLWSYEIEGRDTQIHHDIALMPNGHILMSVWESIPPQDFTELGISDDNLPGEGENLYYDILIEVDPANNEIVWQWRLLDYSIQDVNNNLPNYGIPAAHPQRIDINYNPRPPILDRSHINAITYHPELNQIMVSAHFYSEIWIISRETDELIYRWGNPEAYGRGLPEDQQLYLQHQPTWLDNGNILIFNNGSARLRAYSTVIEIVPPLNADGSYDLLVGSAYAPLDVVSEYRATPPESFYAPNISGAQRLPGGNTLITNGPGGRFFEIDANGEIVWEYLTPIWSPPEAPAPGVIFRATRYLPDYPAFSGRSLIGQGEVPYTLLDPGR